MVSAQKAKTAALIIAVSVVLASLADALSSLIFHLSPSWDWSAVGVSAGCGLLQRVGWSFFHASVIHALMNAWCLLSVVFLFPVSIRRLTVAFVIAVCVPDFCLSDVPTVGLSCVCYALLGSVSFMVSRPALPRWFLCMALYVGVGFLFPNVNAIVHLYGYLAGLSVGLLTAPLSWVLRKK